MSILVSILQFSLFGSMARSWLTFLAIMSSSLVGITLHCAT
jgi:hypothetical protein